MAQQSGNSQTGRGQSHSTPQLKFDAVHGEGEDQLLPSRAYEGDAGIDLYAYLPKPSHPEWSPMLLVGPGQVVAVPTGIRVELPEGHFGMVVPRSGRSKRRPFSIPNAPGIIDAHYRGEIRVLQRNNADGPMSIEHGEGIAQLIVVPFRDSKPVRVEKINENTERAEKGFGSSDKNG